MSHRLPPAPYIILGTRLDFLRMPVGVVDLQWPPKDDRHDWHSVVYIALKHNGKVTFWLMYSKVVVCWAQNGNIGAISNLGIVWNMSVTSCELERQRKYRFRMCWLLWHNLWMADKAVAMPNTQGLVMNQRLSEMVSLWKSTVTHFLKHIDTLMCMACFWRVRASSVAFPMNVSWLRMKPYYQMNLCVSPGPFTLNSWCTEVTVHGLQMVPEKASFPLCDIAFCCAEHIAQLEHASFECRVMEPSWKKFKKRKESTASKTASLPWDGKWITEWKEIETEK